MKKVVFFQLEAGVAGEASGVNRTLARAMAAAGWQVHCLFLCRAGREPASPGVRTVVLSPRPWGAPSGAEVRAQAAKGHLFRAAGLLLRRRKREKDREKLYARAKETLREIDPDRIVTSHYLVLDGVPEELLDRTIHHERASFAAVKKKEEHFRALRAYRDRIRFLWASPAVCEKAAAEGFVRSAYLWDPVPFTAPRTRVEEKRKVVIVSRFTPSQNLPRVAALLKETLPVHWRVEFWGEGEDKGALAAAIDGDRRFLIRGNTADPKAVFATAAFTVNASLSGEVPQSLLEAAACGVPALSFFPAEDAGSFLRNGESAVLVEKGDWLSMEDALRVLFTTPGWRRSLSLALHDAARDFTLEKVKQNWLDLLNE